MRISSGLSEINLGSVQGQNNKAYMWPKLNQPKVNAVPSVERGFQQAEKFSKLSEEETQKVIKRADENSYSSYTSTGTKSMNKQLLSPGSLFTAFA